MQLRTLTIVLAALTAWGCSSAAPPAGSTPGASGGPAPAPSAGPGLAGGAEAFSNPASLASLAEVAAFENQLVDGFAAAVDLPTDLGPETWAWSNDLLRTELAKGGNDITLTGAATRTASLEGAPPRTAVDGGGAIGLGMAVGLVLIGLGDASGTPPSGNVTLDSTSDVVENGERTVGAVTGHISMSASGSTVEADVEIGVDVTVTDAATGAPIRTGSIRSTGKITLGFCPDADGKITGRVALSLTGGTGATGSGSLEIDAEVTGTVGDDAYLQSVEIVGQSTSSTSTAGQPARRLVTTAAFGTAIDRSGRMDVANVRGTSTTIAEEGGLSQADADEAARQIGGAAGVAVWLLGDRAQAKWRNGACVEIRATEQSRTVRKSELVQFEARPWHRTENRELSKTIVPEFAGRASLDPVGVEVPSPVLLSFKAGPRSRDIGTITLTSTSNRGIGTLTIEFTVEGGWIIDSPSGGGRIHGEKCGDPAGDWIVEGTYNQAGFTGDQTWTFTIGPDEQTGTMVYSSTAQGTFAGVTIYSYGVATGTVTLTIQDDGSAQMEVVEEERGYFTTTTRGGHGTNTPLPPQTYPGGLTWQPGGNC